mgnify:CR=1 FL=1
MIGEDAAIVEKVAVAVEKISAKLKSDVIKAKDVVHEVNDMHMIVHIHENLLK